MIETEYWTEFDNLETSFIASESASFAAYIEVLKVAQEQYETEQCRLAGLLQESVDTGANAFGSVTLFASAAGIQALASPIPAQAGDEWHHLLPKQFSGGFLKAGISDEMRNSARYGWILDWESHRGKDGLHPKWNREWAAFFESLTFKNAKDEDVRHKLVEAQLTKMRKKYLTVGTQATVSYSEWRTIKNGVEEAAEELAEQAKKTPGRTFKKVVKFAGKGLKIAVVVTVINDVAKEGVVVAAENAGRDIIWPLPAITGKAQNVINGLTDHGIDLRHGRETYDAPPIDAPLSPRSLYPWMK